LRHCDRRKTALGAVGADLIADGRDHKTQDSKGQPKMKNSRTGAALASMLAGICALFGAATSAHAWSGNNTGQWFTFTSGSYTLYTDEWGSTNPIVMYYNSATNWCLYVKSGSFTGGGVKAYPHTQVTTNVSDSTSVSGSYNGSPASGTFDFAWDNWDSNGAEYMIWEDWGGGAGPLGSEVKSNVSIDGSTYNIYSGNDGHECISFLKTSTNTSGSQNCNQIQEWAVTNKYTSSSTISNIEMGYEVSSTSGSGNSNWIMNSFSASW
jgi:hypothetical protein